MMDLERTLDECLSGLQSGSLSVEACLSRYPQFAAQLRPMLNLAVVAQTASAAPSSAFRLRLRAQLLERGSQARARPPLRFHLASLRTAAALVTLAVVVLTTGTAFAQPALPGAALYAWKRASEAAWRGISADTVGVDLVLSRRRLDEWIAVSEDSNRGQAALEEYQQVVTQLLAADTPEHHDRIHATLKAEQEVLEAAGLTLPFDEGFPWIDSSRQADDQSGSAATPVPSTSDPEPAAEPGSQHLTAVPPSSTATP